MDMLKKDPYNPYSQKKKFFLAQADMADCMRLKNEFVPKLTKDKRTVQNIV